MNFVFSFAQHTNNLDIIKYYYKKHQKLVLLNVLYLFKSRLVKLTMKKEQGVCHQLPKNYSNIKKQSIPINIYETKIGKITYLRD